MKYKLVVVEPAEFDVDEIYRYILKRSSQGADTWYRAFVACTERIVRQPLACSIAPEDGNFSFELRQAMFKTRYGDAYRCLYTVVDDEVRLLRVRGRGQPPVKASDVADS